MIKIREWLYQGKYRDTIDLELLQKHNIQAILHLAENVQHPNIETLYIPIEDGYPIPDHYIQQGVDFVLAHQTQPVLIACGAGISRSSTYTAAVLKMTENLALTEALIDIRQKHPHALPHPLVWQSLCKYYDEPFKIEDLFV